MYHAIGERGEEAARFVLPVEAFEKQVAWLSLEFNVLRLEDSIRRLFAGETLPPRAVSSPSTTAREICAPTSSRRSDGTAFRQPRSWSPARWEARSAGPSGRVSRGGRYSAGTRPSSSSRSFPCSRTCARTHRCRSSPTSYSAACSVRIGMNRLPKRRHELRRYEILGDRPLKRFEHALAHAA
jgi:hypothetical protein